MLKSTFKKVSAIAIAGTMLAGMMAVPANAMTEVMEDYQKPVWSQDFTDIEPTSKEQANNGSSLTDQVFVEGKMKYSSGAWAYTTMTVTDEKKLEIIHDNAANALLLSVFPASPVTLTADKKSNINFDFCMSNIKKYDETTTSDKRKSLSRAIGVNSDGLTGTTDLITFSSTSSDTIDAVVLTFVGSSDKTNIDPGTTYNFNIEIDRGANTRTLTIKNGEAVVKTITATGTADIASINDVYFKVGGWTRGHTTTVDNINITTGAERGTGKLTSDLSKTLVDEKFDNLEDTTVSTDKYTPIAGTVFKARKLASSWGGNVSASKTEDGAARFTLGDGETFVRADLGNIPIAPTDEIRVSYDRTRGSSSVHTWITDTEELSPSHKLTSVRGGKSGTDAIDKTADGNCKIRPGGIQRDGAYGGERSMLADTIYHVEYIIKVSDPEYGNKQTVTVKVADDNGQAGNHNGSGKDSAFIETYYLDLDPDTEAVDKFTSLNSFMLKSSYGGTKDVDFDNVKVEVIKPGFEVKDVANSGNTYSFNSDAPIALNYLVDASANSKVVIAQYADGGRMISATTEDLAATGAGTVTVTPNSTAKTIKAMVIDMNSAVPFAKVFVMTRQ